MDKSIVSPFFLTHGVDMQLANLTQRTDTLCGSNFNKIISGKMLGQLLPVTSRYQRTPSPDVSPQSTWSTCQQHSLQDWIGLSSVLRLRQHSTGYMGDGLYRSKDPTNSIKVLKVHIVHRQIKHTIIRQ